MFEPKLKKENFDPEEMLADEGTPISDLTVFTSETQILDSSFSNKLLSNLERKISLVSAREQQKKENLS